MTGLELLLLVPTLALALPAAVLALQVAAGRAPRGPLPAAPARAARPRAAVLMPAHNEAAGIAEALAAVRPQLRPGDRLLVVADNCSDATAAIAAASGAEVAPRHDAARRGKGYALDFGVRRLAADPPEVLVMLDADCRLHEGGLERLVAACASHAGPVQALYLMRAGPGAGLRERIAEFAWRVKNQLRPLGALRLGAPCQLMGTGMAFPWPLIADAPLASGHLVEDMKLGIDLALTGRAPRFEPRALVTSRFPEPGAATTRQRTRWEHGHLATLLSDGPRLMARGLARRDLACVALALDLMVPPLALLLGLTTAMAAINLGAWALWDARVPVLASAMALALLGAMVLVAWARVGRDLLRLRELACAPLYAAAKLPIYLRFLIGRQVDWVRAKRDGD
jgi:cellulose synthase/poly-beta-1,6-N-acetylglucosamine synthase-like glycosyltransferase